MTIAVCQRIEKLARSVQENDADVAALAAIKIVNAQIVALLARGYLDVMDPRGVTHLYRATMMTQRTLRSLPRQDRPKGWDAQLAKAHTNFSHLIEKLLILRAEKLETSVTSDQLPESKTRFESVAHKAAELAEDIKSLKEAERARIAEILTDVLGHPLSEKFRVSADAPQAASPVKLPTKPIEKWHGENKRGRPRKDEARETAVEFVRRVYGQYFEHGFTREHLRAIDPVLESNLRGFEKRHPDQYLADFPSIPMGTRTRQLIAELSRHLSEDELRRVGMALNSRYYRTSPSADAPPRPRK